MLFNDNGFRFPYKKVKSQCEENLTRKIEGTDRKEEQPHNSYYISGICSFAEKNTHLQFLLAVLSFFFGKIPRKSTASSISLQFGLKGLIIAGRITVVEAWVISEAAAAPDAPHDGISARFSTTLSAAALTYRYFRYFCLFSHTIHAFLATPR